MRADLHSTHLRAEKETLCLEFTNTATLRNTTRQTGRSACVVRATAEESGLWLPQSKVK